MLVFVFTPRFFCENDDDDGIIKIALFVQSFPCITRHHWLCCGGGSHFHRFLSPREEHLVQNGIVASSFRSSPSLFLAESRDYEASFGCCCCCCCCCGSHFHRFLSPREEHLVQNGIVSFRSSPSLFLVESRDFRLSLFCRCAFRVSQFHLVVSQAFVSFRRFQPRKLFRFSRRIIERPLDVFLERFLSQLGDASRAKLRLAPLVVDEPGEHGLRELREVLLEFQSVAVHLWWCRRLLLLLLFVVLGVSTTRFVCPFLKRDFLCPIGTLKIYHTKKRAK